ncbi:Catabolite control protein A [Microbacterium ginsengisoli]|jgi:DNA-binding LacI/PurR family transcriptional regulator|uniref:Catabolite control protein A n=1 Tax=Microbacterium ginsengisoli TaxID=400772 RepID=A0A0F0LU80_9MICO|nr:Catabolite control protein A [Microbacterium ginsengisoli]
MKGSRVSGIADVARLAGVSKSTASRALSGGGYVSEETRKKVTDAATTLGYVASANAAGLATGRTRTIAVIVPRVNRWYFGSMIEGITRALIPAGYDLTLYVAEPASQDRESMYRFFLARKRFDGVLAVALEPDDDDIEKLIGIGKPTLCVGNGLNGIPTIGIDNIAIGRMITQHLITLGHREIAFLGVTPYDSPRARDVADRCIGYEQAMRQAGLEASMRSTPSTLTVTDGYAAAVPLLADMESRPTAIVAACDEIAIGAIIAARRLGVPVPGQLSVVGVDGHDYAEMFGLTTIVQHPEELGELAARTLLSLIDGDTDVPDRLQLPTRLVVRSSTTAPATSGA